MQLHNMDGIVQCGCMYVPYNVWTRRTKTHCAMRRRTKTSSFTPPRREGLRFTRPIYTHNIVHAPPAIQLCTMYSCLLDCSIDAWDGDRLTRLSWEPCLLGIGEGEGLCCSFLGWLFSPSACPTASLRSVAPPSSPVRSSKESHRVAFSFTESWCSEE